MNPRQPTNEALVRLLEPWFPLLVEVGSASERDFVTAFPVLGPPRKTERANDLHRAFRTNFRHLCDMAEPILTLCEEPEGKALDYIRCNMNPDMPFALRWGRFGGESVRRNRTERNHLIQEQGWFASAMSDEDLPSVTLAHTIEDEYTEAGRTCLWIGRLLLIRERYNDSEVITEVHVYQKPNRNDFVGDIVPPPLVVSRQNEKEKWEQMVRRILA